MNICLLTRALPVHSKGGLEFHSHDLARGLAARGHAVTVLTSAHPRGAEIETDHNLTIHFLPGTTSGKYSVSFFRRLNKRLRQLDGAEHYDVIHSQGFAGMFLPGRTLRAIGQRFVVTIHGTLFSETPLYREHFRRTSLAQKVKHLWRYKHRIAVYPFYRRLLKYASRIIVDSEFTYNELKLSRGSIALRARVVPLGVPEDRYPLVSKTDARKKLSLDGTILFTLGRLEEMKGVKMVLEAMSMIGRKDFHYLIGGSGRQERVLREFCHAKGLSNARFLGEVAGADVPYYLAAADLFIYPELAQPAFGLVAIEAMLQGMPVLASRAGAIPEVVTPQVGFLFERANASSLARELRRLLDSPQMLQTAAARSRSYALKNFSYKAMIERTVAVYSEVVPARND